MKDSYIFIIKGNYDSFVKTKQEMEEHQMKQYKKQQDEIAHMKVSIDTFFIILI